MRLFLAGCGASFLLGLACGGFVPTWQIPAAIDRATTACVTTPREK